jgi:hypothetical protein
MMPETDARKIGGEQHEDSGLSRFNFLDVTRA